jgi:hypothetical protein
MLIEGYLAGLAYYGLTVVPPNAETLDLWDVNSMLRAIVIGATSEVWIPPKHQRPPSTLAPSTPIQKLYLSCLLRAFQSTRSTLTPSLGLLQPNRIDLRHRGLWCWHASLHRLRVVRLRLWRFPVALRLPAPNPGRAGRLPGAADTRSRC